jgi:hypothetical protein
VTVVIHYLAGSPGAKHLEREANRAHANNFLFTFGQPGARQCAKYFCVQPQRRIFIDSGAFTVWTKGKKVDLGKYIAFCKQIKNIAKCQLVFAALDVIPGKKNGSAPTAGEIDRGFDEGWDNYQSMKQEGISPCLMTFHQFDRRRWLTQIADDSDYFAVAPRKSGVTEQEKSTFLRNVFNYINGKGSLPSKKVHGLGISSLGLMKQFPFYSVDNSGWLVSIRAHVRAQAGQSGTAYKKLDWWKQRALADGIPAEGLDDLRQMLGYRLREEKADPEGHSGDYFLMYLAIDRAVEMECRVTDFWREQGVDWGDHPRHDRFPLLCNSLLPKASVVEA